MTHTRLALSTLSILSLLPAVFADLDAVDWVNVEYVLHTPANAKSATKDAQASIVRSAMKWGAQASFSVANKEIRPPSGDPHDYLSWAPYHWPDCNWCSKSGHSHLSQPGDTGPDVGNIKEPSNGEPPDPLNRDVTYESVQEPFNMSNAQSLRMKRSRRSPSLFDDLTGGILGGLGSGSSSGPKDSGTGGGLGGLGGLGQLLPAQQEEPNVSAPVMPAPPTAIADAPVSIVAVPSLAVPTPPTASLGNPESIIDGPIMTSTTASRPTGSGVPAPARHAAKPSKCTPSPNAPMPPSATWTTCPYVRRDGKVNPDVKELNGPPAIQHVSDAVRHSSMAYVLQNDRSFSKNVVRFVKTFFFDEATRMNPNVNFGQIVRGPGPSGQKGTWTGILDLRGLVKVLNGLSILKAANCPDWTAEVDQAMSRWMSTYASWLDGSPLGKDVATRPNNHNSFYVSQVAAAKLYSGDRNGAAEVLQNFFDKQFKDQIAKSGEQPFEAARTRPQHYRAFNLEALITNAKLGDQVGKNFWIARSKYGATIQDAVDFSMKQPFNKEDPTDLTPHVAAIAAQYGDPTGKYATFLRSHQSSYQGLPYWFFDQPAAFKNTSVKKRSLLWVRDVGDAAMSMDGTGLTEPSMPDPPEANVPFECPEVFKVLGPKVELDNDLFITCDELKDLYERT